MQNLSTNVTKKLPYNVYFILITRKNDNIIDLLRFLLCIGDQLLVPVQIFEFQCADVSRPHTKKDRQKKHRIISFSNRIATVNNGQQLPHFFWAPCFGDIFFNVDFGPWNTWR